MESIRQKPALWPSAASFILGIIVFVLLSLVLTIPFIIYIIYWSFSAFVLIDQNIGVWKSIKKSKEIIKGHWWLVFGYLILISIIAFIALIVVSLPQIISALLILVSPILGWIAYVIGTLIRIVGQLLITVFVMLFIKNFYLELKSKKSEKVK